jgi:two-component system alkaline phosphatase synthesis response regulator PhoP
MKVLIVEDDAYIRDGLVEILESEGYQTQIATNGQAALATFRREVPDFILLDIMMPEMNGYDVCRAIRRDNDHIPIIFISAKSEEIDRVLGLELGADDYIQKPFGVKEVVARIRAVTRRCIRVEPSRIDGLSFEMNGLTVYPAELRGKRSDQVIDLSLRDISILRLLHRHVGRVVDREMFFRECWGLEHLPNSRTLDQHISKLRKRIEVQPRDPEIIRTVHGVGYRYEES